MLTNLNKLALAAYCLQTVFGFNIDVSQEAVTSFKINVTEAAGLSNYAGYKVSVFTNDSHVRLTLGAPKYKRDTAKPFLSQGSVIQCTAQLNNQLNLNKQNASTDNKAAWVSNLSCKVIISDDDNTTTEGSTHIKGLGSLGSTLFQTSRLDTYTVCAPRRTKQCGTTHASPGACYTGTLPNNIKWLDWNERSCYKNFLDVMFVVDSSGSISNENFNIMKNVMLNVSDSFELFIGETAQVGILQYGQNNPRNPNYASEDPRFYKTPLKFTECKSVQCIKDAITTNMKHLYAANTYTALAIERAVKLDFAKSANKNSTKFLILITDGQATDRTNLMQSYQLTSEKNITVYAVGVGDLIIMEELRISANGNSSNDRVLTAANFDLLAEALNDITNQIAQTGAEGEQSSEDIPIEESLINNVFGFSGLQTKSGNQVFGAVGSYRNMGTLVNFNSTSSALSFENVISALPNLTDATNDCYLGYATSSGRYEDSSSTYITTSAPRYLMHGAVAVYEESKMGTSTQVHYTIQPHDCVGCEQNNLHIGSYFGGALLTADFNNDGLDDLLVGAPLYIGQTYDEGRVYVYMSQGRNTLKIWSTSTYIPTILDGRRDIAGRFGFTMTSLGDLNNDGYNDVMIAAPYAEDGNGVVYVYHGSSTGIKNVIQQRIQAKVSNNINLLNFGLTLEGGIDLDGNLYPDVLIGSPTSDHITVLRTRPLLIFNNSLNFIPHKLDILKCLSFNSTKTCSILRLCFSYDGKSVEPLIGLDYNLSIDTMLKRLFVQELSPDKTSWNLNVTLEKAVKTCIDFQVLIRTEYLTDFDSSITASVNYSMQQKHLATPISSIEDPSINKSLLAVAIIEKGCGLENACIYDLVTTAEAILPNVASFSNSSSVIFQNTSVLFVGSDDPVVLKVNFTNLGENAFETQVSISYSTQLLWLKIQNLKSSTPNQSACVREEENDKIIGNERTKTPSYFHDAQPRSIMANGSWCYFEVILSTTPLKNSGTHDSVFIRILTYSNISSGEEADTSDNSWNATFPVLYRSDFSTLITSAENEVVFNFTKEPKNISTVYEVGVNITDVDMEMEIRGNGYSNIPQSTFKIKYPSTLKSKLPLLYLYGLQCVTQRGTVTSKCDQTNVNTYKLDIVPAALSNRTGNFTVQPNPNSLDVNVFDCTGNSTSTSAICDVATCDITSLKAFDVVRCKATFRLWTQTLNISSKNETSFLSELMYDASESRFLINADGNIYQPSVMKVSTKAKLYEAPALIIPPATWWIYVSAITGGVVFLAILVAILYKMGFFKSKYSDLKEQIEWQVADMDGTELEGNYEPTYENEIHEMTNPAFEDEQ